MTSPNPDPAAKPVRRTFTAEYRNQMIDEYEAAPHGQKAAVLRREGLHQSQIREWSMARASKKVPPRRRRRPAAAAAEGGVDADRVLRAENERLTRQNARLAREVNQTQAALEIMGKLHALLDNLSESTDTTTSPKRP
jgi:transposase